MRETIVIDALKDIQKNGTYYGKEWAAERSEKALTDWASAPKEGWEDDLEDLIIEFMSEAREYSTKTQAASKAIISFVKNLVSSAPESGQKINIDDAMKGYHEAITRENFTGCKYNPPTTTTDDNGITFTSGSAPGSGGEETEIGLKRPIRALRYACDFFKVKNLNEFLDKHPKEEDQWLFNELSKAHEKGAEDFQVSLHSEQEDKRSVATKSNQGGDAGNKIKDNDIFKFPESGEKAHQFDSSLSKEEGKDEEYVWVIARDWKGDFVPEKVLKSEADKVNIKQHKTIEECGKTMSGIWIEPDH